MATRIIPYASQLPEEWRKPATVTFEPGTRLAGVLRYDNGPEVSFILGQKYVAPHLCLMLGINTLEEPLDCLYDFVDLMAPKLPASIDEFCTKANTHGFQFRPAEGV